jgi:Cu/Ag efflux pump CusA
VSEYQCWHDKQSLPSINISVDQVQEAQRNNVQASGSTLSEEDIVNGTGVLRIRILSTKKMTADHVEGGGSPSWQTEG